MKRAEERGEHRNDSSGGGGREGQTDQGTEGPGALKLRKQKIPELSSLKPKISLARGLAKDSQAPRTYRSFSLGCRSGMNS